MASLPMFAMHVWSEPSHVVVVACFPECSRALASRCLAGCRSIQTTTATNYYIQLLALAVGAQGVALKAVFKERDRVRWTPPNAVLAG